MKRGDSVRVADGSVVRLLSIENGKAVFSVETNMDVLVPASKDSGACQLRIYGQNDEEGSLPTD